MRQIGAISEGFSWVLEDLSLALVTVHATNAASKETYDSERAVVLQFYYKDSLARKQELVLRKVVKYARSITESVRLIELGLKRFFEALVAVLALKDEKEMT